MFLKYAALGACFLALTACQNSKVTLAEKNAHQSSRDETQVANPFHDETAVQANVQDDDLGAAGIDKTVSGSITNNPGGGKIVIASYRPPKVGTVFYWKNNWNSLPPRLVHKVTSHTASFQGKTAIQMDAVEDTGNGTKTYYDATSSNLLGHEDKNGNPVVVFPQVEERLRFPMRPGDKWMTTWKSVDRSTQKTTKGGGVVKVIGAEKLTVAGKHLKTMKIRLPLPTKLGRGMKHFIWYSPKLGVVVREQISNGTFVWVKELEKIKLPG